MQALALLLLVLFHCEPEYGGCSSPGLWNCDPFAGIKQCLKP